MIYDFSLDTLLSFDDSFRSHANAIRRPAKHMKPASSFI